MKSFILVFSLFVLSNRVFSQSIYWVSGCENANFCLNAGSCAQGNVNASVQAGGGCSTLDYSYKLDLNDNGTFDQNGSGNTIANMALPKGTHRIVWRANDACGEIGTCTSKVTVKDCLPPNMVCRSSLSQGIFFPDCSATFTSDQFILNISDNCTPNNQIQLGVRAEGTGTGFPTTTSISFNECQLGLNTVEVWSKDASGLTSKCFCFVSIQSNSGSDCVCNPDADVSLRGCVRTVSGKKVGEFKLKSVVQSTGGVAPPISKAVRQTMTDSCFDFGIHELPFGGDYHFTLEASRTGNPTEGVTTLDLLKISKNILGVEPLTSMYELMAADVNRSKSITSFDIVEIRKLILGIYDTFPAVKSWRVFKPIADPSVLDNWSADTAIYRFSKTDLLSDTVVNGFHFVALKSGDVNNSASFGPDADDRSENPVFLFAENSSLVSGEETILNIKVSEPAEIEGFQMELAFEDGVAEILEVLPGVADLKSPDVFQPQKGVCKISFLVENGLKISAGETLFSLKIKALRDALLVETLKMVDENLSPEIYINENAEPLARPIEIGFRENSNPAETPQFFQPQPNPFSEKTSFAYRAEFPEDLIFEIFDVQGKRVFILEKFAFDRFQKIEISREDLPGTGLFFWRSRLGSQTWQGKLIKI